MSAMTTLDENTDLKAVMDAMRERHWGAIEAAITNVVKGSNDKSSLEGMLDYHFATGGKRLRAMLPLLTAQALDVDPAVMVPFGGACEMLHNATLVHDDLQDGDAIRRGRDTVWKKYGIPQAINLGDAMFYYALLLIQEMDVPIERREKASRRMLTDTLLVIDGQEREFALKENESPTLDDYFRMVEGKTSGLFALPMAGAAHLCGAHEEVVNALSRAAQDMGVVFQIQDDILDLYGDKGREIVGTDVAEGKRSAMAVHCLQNAPAEDSRWLKAVLDAPRDETSPDQIAQASDLFKKCGSLDFALEEIDRRRKAAISVPALADRTSLVALVDGMCEVFLAPIADVVAAHKKEGA